MLKVKVTRVEGKTNQGLIVFGAITKLPQIKDRLELYTHDQGVLLTTPIEDIGYRSGIRIYHTKNSVYELEVLE